MNRTSRFPLQGLALLLLAGIACATADAKVLAPAMPAREATPAIPTEIEADPVLSALDSIGQPSAMPRIGEMADVAPRARMSGDGGGGDAIFPGGAASTTGGMRFLEGVSDARDPLELLPPEPSVAQRVPVPAAAGLLIWGVASLALLRGRVRRRPRPASRAGARSRRR